MRNCRQGETQVLLLLLLHFVSFGRSWILGYKYGQTLILESEEWKACCPLYDYFSAVMFAHVLMPFWNKLRDMICNPVYRACKPLTEDRVRLVVTTWNESFVLAFGRVIFKAASYFATFPIPMCLLFSCSLTRTCT